jgi:hypothetical protein
MNFLCRLFPGRCPSEAREAREPPAAEQTAAPVASADLGQREARNEARSKEQLGHMERGPAVKSAQQKKPKRRPRNAVQR